MHIYWRVYEHIPYFGIYSHQHARSCIYQNPMITGRSHEHTGFWYIYGRAYEHTLFWYLISTTLRLSELSEYMR